MRGNGSFTGCRMWKQIRFRLSALLWVCVVTGLGYALSMIPFVKRHEDQVMTCLMILPIALLLAGLLGTLFVVIKKKYCSA